MPTFSNADTALIVAYLGGNKKKTTTSTTSTSTADVLRPTYGASTTTTTTTSSSNKKPKKSSSTSSTTTVTPSADWSGLSSSVYQPTTPTVAAKPAAPKIKRKKTEDTTDTFTQAVNQWRDSNMNVQPMAQQGPRPRPTQPFTGYDVKPTTVDFALNRPNTGVNAVQPSATIGGQTVTSDIGPQIGPRQPTRWDTGVNSWLTQDAPPVAMMPPVAPLVQTAYNLPWREMAGAIGEAARQGITPYIQNAQELIRNPVAGYPYAPALDDFKDTAAWERAQFDINQRNQERNKALGQTWGEWANTAGENISNAWGGLQNALARQTIGQGNAAEVGLGTISTALTPVGEAFNLTNPSRVVKDFGLNVASGLQAGQDLIYNYPYLPGDLPPAAYISSFTDTVMNDPNRQKLEQVNPEMIVRRWGDFWKTYVQNLNLYKQAVTPTAEQIGFYGRKDIPKAQEYAWLNALGGAQSVESTFDAIVDQDKKVLQLNADARRLFLAGAQQIDEDARQELWTQAAQKGAEAYRLQNTHPIALVNENTNLNRQLLFELLLPDATDLLGKLFGIADLTPKARRLTSTTSEVLTTEERAIKALQKMIVEPANQAAIMTERSDYNKLWNLWTTGTSRAKIATDKMVRYTVNLLSDVETPADARVILNQLATDPTKLISGVKADLFQSPGLIARADEKGLIRFGSMNLQNLQEPLRIYQQAAQDLLTNSKTLQGGPVFDKLNFFLDEFIPSIQQQGWRFYNVADDMPNVPTGAKTTRLRAVQGGQYVVEYVDSTKKVISTSDPMLIQDARKLQNAFKGGRISAPSSFIGNVGSFMRKFVSPFYILGNPGTWATNAISGVANAMGDGVWSTETAKAMETWKTKLYGLDPTMRGLEGVETSQGFAKQTLWGRGPFKWLRNAYSNIDENAGRRVWHASAQHALRTVGKPLLQQTLTPILQQMGITNPRRIRQITSKLFEVGYSGGNMAEEWARLMTNNGRIFSLSEVNPQWLGAIPETALEDFYGILRTATTRDEAITQLTAWRDKAAKYWDNLIEGQAPTPQRHVWMKQEVAQDTADLVQSGKMAQKYGNVPQETVQAFVQQTATALQDIKRQQDTLLQLVADAKDPANRYMLYNIWGQVTDLTANVRAQLGELAEAAGTAPKGAARQAAWGEYWTEAQRLWTERNQAVSNLLEQSATNLASGKPFNPQFDVWQTLERTAQQNEAKLWDALRLEPQSATYDARLKTVIDAGRAIADKSMARVYAAARRFTNVDAIDHIVSAEHNVQMAGAKARAYLDKVLDQVLNSKNPNWERYYSIRNETWRQLRQYERDVWGLAERNIVSEGLANEATTGLRFDAGPDGVVELIRPEAIPTQRTNKLGAEKVVTQEDKAYWTVKREDGTITRVPDSMVPQNLKDRFNGLTPAEIESQVQVEMDNIASAEPFAEEAQRVLDGPDAAVEVLEPELQPPAQFDEAVDALEVRRLGIDEAGNITQPVVDAMQPTAPVEDWSSTVGQTAEAAPYTPDYSPAPVVQPKPFRLAPGLEQQVRTLKAGTSTEGMQTVDEVIDYWKAQYNNPNIDMSSVGSGGKADAANRIRMYENLKKAGVVYIDERDFGQPRYYRVVQPTAPVAPATISRQQVAELRRMAAAANIGTATEAGQPINKWLVNVINKDLDINIKSLNELTPDQFDEAVDALRTRAAKSAYALPVPDKQALRMTKAQAQPLLQQAAKNLGLTPEQVLAQARQNFIEAVQDQPIEFAIDPEKLDEVLQGQVKNGFQITGDDVNKQALADYATQQWQWGIPTNAPAEQRPIFAFVANDQIAQDQAGLYGSVRLRLKDEVKQRLTYAAGDTGNAWQDDGFVILPSANLTTLDETFFGPYLEAWANKQNIKDFYLNTPIPYVEVQIYGGVRPEDIAAVFPDYNDYTAKLSENAQKYFSERGIPVQPYSSINMVPLDDAKIDEAMGKMFKFKDEPFTPTPLSSDMGEAVQPTKPVFAKSTKGFTAGDIKRGWQDYAYEYKVPPIDELAAKVQAGKNPLTKKQLESMSGLTIAGEKITDMDSVKRFVQQYIDLQKPATRTFESTIPLFDYEAWARKNVGKGLDLSPGIKRAEAAAKTATEGTPDLALGAAFAKQQLDNIYNHVTQNIDEILRPAEGFSQGQTLRALDDFKRQVLPAWDNAKYIASEYGNRMRSFTLVDFANNTRLDELMGLYMPYGFWMTRTAKNSLERAIFEPQIWRRVMQAEQGINSMQEQRGDPERYEGAIPVDVGDKTYYLRLLPSKYWQAFGLFTNNDYADPESANSALGFAMESMRAANLNSYPWFDVATKMLEGDTADIYPVNYTPISRVLADIAIMAGGQSAANRWTVPGFFENNVARVLNNMAVTGEITHEQARAAHDLLWQMKQGGQPLPEQATVFDMATLNPILDKAMRQAAGNDLMGAASSMLTGVNVRPFDPAEKQWTGAQQEYYANQYGPENPYGSNLASDASQADAKLAWSKGAVWKPEEGRPGTQLVTDMKKEEKQAINEDLMTATDNWIASQKKPPTNGQINDFKTKYINQKLDTDAEYYGDAISGYLDDKYPSAQVYDGKGPKYKGYAPEEIKEAVRVAAYYQAKDEIQAPVYPGDKKSREEYKAYYEAKANYEDALEARVEQIINDPVALRKLAGLPVTNAPTSTSDYLRSNSVDTITMDNAFGYPMRPTGGGAGSMMAGPVELAGSPETAKDIIIGERTKYMGPVEKATRAANDAKGDKSGRKFFSRSRGYSRRYYSRRRYSRGGGGGGRRRSYGGGGGGGGFRYTQMPEAERMNSSLWNNGDEIRPWRQWNTNANDWLYAGRDIGPEKLQDWKPIKV